MRGKSHIAKLRPRLRVAAGISGSLIAVLVLAGCSAANLTGFDFPAFGLVKKSDKDPVETVGSIDAPAAPQKLGAR